MVMDYLPKAKIENLLLCSWPKCQTRLKRFPYNKNPRRPRSYAPLLNGADSDQVIPKLQKVFGIQNFSPSIRVAKEMSVIRETVK